MPTGLEPVSARDDQPLQIGRWTVEPSLNRISAPGETVRLEPKAMALLVLLARRPGEVVDREALIGALWPKVVVGDDSLTQVVVKLRKALGDAGAQPAYIETISKKGYRLIAPVTRPVAAAEAGGEAPVRVQPGARRRARLWAGAGILALVAGTASWLGAERSASVGPGERGTQSASRAAERPTIAVTPFKALGNDPQETLLAQGITADLVTDLSKTAGIWVIAATDARIPGKADTSVSVSYIVSGTVQRSEGRLRLHVHLADARTGRQLWSERFDRELDALFDVQDELGARLLDALPLQVGKAERWRVARRYTRNLEAYEHFQRGQAALHVRQKAENELARDLFRRALALDPAFARAYTGLAQTYAADYRNQWTDRRAAALDRALEFARTAQQINPDIPETHWTLAYAYVHRREHDRALLELDKALRLNPSYADAYAFMGGIETGRGRPAEGVALLRTAMRLNPEAGYLYFMLLGRAYLFLGDLEQARLNLEHSLLRNPEFLDARVYMAALHLAAGDKAAAAWEAEEIRSLRPDFNARSWLETNPTADAALRARLLQTLVELGL